MKSLRRVAPFSPRVGVPVAIVIGAALGVMASVLLR